MHEVYSPGIRCLSKCFFFQNGCFFHLTQSTLREAGKISLKTYKDIMDSVVPNALYGMKSPSILLLQRAKRFKVCMT